MLDLHVIYALAASIVIPATIGLIHYRILERSLKTISLLLLLGMLTETVMITLSLLKINNLFTLHFYALMEIGLFSLYFYRQIQNSVMKRLIVIVLIGLSAFAVIYAVYGNNIAEFNSLPRATECLYFSFLSAWLFYEMADYTRTINGGHYFINGAILFYFTSCFLIFTFSKYNASNLDMIFTMFSTHAFINAFCNLAYATGLWIASRQYSTQQ